MTDDSAEIESDPIFFDSNQFVNISNEFAINCEFNQ